MSKISVIFRCYKRPILTKLCLERLVELLQEESKFELLAVYDDNDGEYIDMLNSVEKFVYIGTVCDRHTNSRNISMGENYNRVHDRCSGDLILNMENDWFYVEKCMEKAIDALNYMDVIRLCMTPYTVRGHAGKVTEYAGVFKQTVKYPFTLNAHLRKDPYPAGRFPDKSRWYMESEYSIMCKEKGVVCGFTLEDYFTHLGFINSGGRFRQYHLKFIYGYDWPQHVFAPRIVEWFDSICDDTYYRDMFRKHLRKSNYMEQVYPPRSWLDEV